jgi:phosphoribosyl 1,2-cyclic phosphodiesterase
MSERFTIRFRGVRGSYPAPGPQTVRFGGNTACVEVHAGGHTLALDAGTGIIGLGADLVKQYRNRPAAAPSRLHVTVVLTHMHHDHIQGYPFFGPLHLPQATLHVFGPRMLREDLATALSGAMVEPYFPVDAESVACERRMTTISERDAIVFEPWPASPEPRLVPVTDLVPDPERLTVRASHCLAHPRGGVFVYRVEYGGRSLVYATDLEGYVGGDKKLIRFAAGTDVLVHDAQFRHDEYLDGGKQGWGHSSAEMAVDVARQCGAARLVLFHHAPTNDDAAVARIEREAQAFFPATLAAYEGLEIDL